MKIRLFLLLVAGGVLAATAHAQTEQGDASAGSEDIFLEEIEVRGQKSVGQLQKVVLEARLDFWDVYNTINSIDEYRVVCEKRASIGTGIKKTRCVPRYFSEKMSELTQQQFLQRGAGGPPPTERNVILETKGTKAAADRHMIKLIEQNPSLRKKYETLLEANRALERAKLRDQ